MKINTIFPGYISGSGGPGYACNCLLEAISDTGIDAELFCVTGDNWICKPFHRYSMPLWAKPIGYKLLSENTWGKYTEWRYLRSLKNQDIAYIWNNTSIATYKAVKAAGNVILTECVNTHRAYSKRILDAEYHRLGITPEHYFREIAIAHENAQLQMVDYIFSPSREVTKSLLESEVSSEKIIQTSYGLSASDILAPQEVAGRTHKNDLTAIFVGRIGIRKGIHLLLEYWTKAGVKGKLKLVGRIESSAKHMVEPYLSRNDIEHVPFTSDLKSVYSEADIFLFPSLEEGSPLVTYLALGAGLASIVSPMGGDGIINHGIEGLVVDAHNADEWIGSIRRLFSDAEFRLTMSSKAYSNAEKYLWSNVGRQRVESLRASLASRYC